MIRKEKGEFTAECDNCGDEQHGGVISVWHHYCPECKE